LRDSLKRDERINGRAIWCTIITHFTSSYYSSYDHHHLNQKKHERPSERECDTYIISNDEWRKFYSHCSTYFEYTTNYHMMMMMRSKGRKIMNINF
jgi:hypothetical protein